MAMRATRPSRKKRTSLGRLSKTSRLSGPPLSAQVFYDQTYLLPSSLTVRTDAHADGFDLRAAAESEAAKAISEQARGVRNLLPSELELLWDWALEQPQDVLLKVLAVAVAHTVTPSRARTTTPLPAD
jgi:hypothetical protein